MLRSPALLFLLASCGAAELDGLYYSFRTGGNPSDVVDRFEARQSGETVTFFRNTRVGQTSPIDTSSAHAFESYRIDGRTLRGSVTATVQFNGDIVWSHGYTSRKQAPSGGGHSARPQRVSLSGYSCANDYGSNPHDQSYAVNGEYALVGHTADGKPYYKNVVTHAHLFYDRNCGGGTDGASWRSGWFFGCSAPSLTCLLYTSDAADE